MAAMWLTIGVDADRTGKKYMDGLDPDKAIQGSRKPAPDDQDAVLQEALRWLSTLKAGQLSCTWFEWTQSTMKSALNCCPLTPSSHALLSPDHIRDRAR